MKHGLSPINPMSASETVAKPGVIKADGRLLDTEIIAIYW
jgi:hypothetical protein